MTESYGFHVEWSEADRGWYAVFSEIPRLTGFGATREEALAELREVLQAVVDAWRDRGVCPVDAAAD